MVIASRLGFLAGPIERLGVAYSRNCRASIRALVRIDFSDKVSFLPASSGLKRRHAQWFAQWR